MRLQGIVQAAGEQWAKTKPASMALEGYERWPYAELAAMKWLELAPIEVNGRIYQPSVFTEWYQGRLLLVVELQRKLLLDFKGTDCMGSIITESGIVERVDAEFLWNEIGHP